MIHSPMAGQTQNQNQGTPTNSSMDQQFEMYFRRADLNQDGRISGEEAVSFFQATGLAKPVLAQIWTHADRNRTGFLGRAEFFNALKLVTVAQSKRELSPDIVKAALFGPASAKIPAPQINLAALPAPRSNANMTPPSVGPPSSVSAPIASQGAGIRGPQGFPSQQNQFMRPPRPPAPNTGFPPQQGGVSQVVPRGGTMVAQRPPSSSLSNDWLGASTAGPQTAVTSQVPTAGVGPSAAFDGFGLATSGVTSSMQSSPQATTESMQHVLTKPSGPTSPALQAGAKDSNRAVSGNGYASNSMFGDGFSATPSQPKQNSLIPMPSAGVSSMSSSNVLAAGGIQQPSQHIASQRSLTHQPSQSQQGHSMVRPDQPAPVQSFSAVPSGPGNSASPQSQLPWPRMTQSDVQKYSKVFMEVDTDRDGKISGEQARNLFLSWRLPREVLKQVWDLSDQDNDSMLSLREFCIALYLMERHREGRPLPRVLPPGIMFEEMPSPATGQAGPAYANPAWRSTSGLQPHGMPGPRPITAAAGARPPRPVPLVPPEDIQPRQQKPRVPVLEKHLVDQLSTEEQSSLNSKFQEATVADKKVSELEKEILESKEKIEYYRTKMQELILYKSRCDNRLNEITERVSADKREVDTLAKKYEDKYKQSGDVASKLTIEEATFRDIQAKKMELYRAIVKLEQDGNADNIQGRVDRIQGNLEEQVKALNERCKMYGLRAKPTSLLELPFGWQPGIQEGAADWDENWDKFEDEGFTFVKELTLDVQNVLAPPKPKPKPVLGQNKAPSDEGATAVSSSNGDVKSENRPGAGNITLEDESSKLQGKEGLERSPPDSSASRKAVDSPSGEVGGQRKEFFERTPPDSPASSKAVDSPANKFDDYPSRKFDGDSSPHALDIRREHGDAESVFSGDKSYDETGWGTSDSHDDVNAGWDINPVKTKETDHETYNENSFFGSDDWGLNPIRTEVPKTSPFAFDSVPGTPALSYAGSPHGDNNMFPKRSPFAFDSVPGTPAYSYAGSPQGDNTFQNRSPFGFADSVPSTPMYNYSNSPRRFSDGPEDHSFNTFARFDSFSSTHDSGLFQPQESFSRFDSMRSPRDSEYDQGSFAPQGSMARFDSMRSTADSDFGNSLFPPRDSTFSRFDSMRSTRDSSDFNHGFPSFDDASDPFGSSDPFRSNDPFKTHDPFKTSAETPRRDSDSWRAF